MKHYTLGEFRKYTAGLSDDTPIIVRSMGCESDYTDPSLVVLSTITWSDSGAEPKPLQCLVLE